MAIDRRQILKATLATPLLASSCGSSIPSEEASDPIDGLVSMTVDLDPIPQSEYDARLERLWKKLQEEKVEAFVAEAGPTLEYFTGASWWRSERIFAAVIGVDRPPIFACPGFEEGRAREKIGAKDAEVRVWQEHESPYTLLGEILSDLGIRNGVVALEPTSRFFLVDGLRTECPTLTVQNGNRISEACRITKTPLEVGYMRLANEITKTAYDAAFKGLEEGMEEQDLAARISRALSKLGSRGGAMVLFGPSSALPHGSEEARTLGPGDVVLVDGGCSINGYRSDVTRTVVYGEASSKHREIWNTVLEAQSAVLELARPGLECQELDRAARKVMTDAGYGPGYRYFTHRLGHGIGLEGHEPPYIVEGIEDVLAITSDGAEVLGERCLELPVLG
jgi:Xaa-Pro dipeptidase